MLKKVIKYVDFNGNPQERTVLFNLSTIELGQMQGEEDGGLEVYIQKIVETQDVAKLMSLFQKIILLAYGEKSPDGQSFIKSDELRTAFSQTAAYNALFNELAFDTNAAVAFINGVIPQELSKAKN